jgi:hypothetical protein
MMQGVSPVVRLAAAAPPEYNNRCPAPNSLPDDSMPTIPQEILLPLVVLIVLWPYLTAQRVQCPDCGEMFPLFYSPFK